MAGPYHGYQGWEEISGISMTSEAARSVCAKGGALENVCPTPLMSCNICKKRDFLNNVILADSSV